MQLYCQSYSNYQRLITREVKIGNLVMGGGQPILIQTMTTTPTLDTQATVAQIIRCINAGADIVRVTAPSKKEAQNLEKIKKLLRQAGFQTPLVADIHFTPNAAEIAARFVEKVRINPGNFMDRKKFEFIEYTESQYQKELAQIAEKFIPLLNICKTYGTALRIGVNHGSLSDRIMSRFGDNPMGMVESALEFIRMARNSGFHNLVISMKSSNTVVMVQAYRLLVHQMWSEFQEVYPLHLGVTEAGDGEDGRVKSAVGIGTLLNDGIGDTIRVSLTEEPEFEIPVCKSILSQIPNSTSIPHLYPLQKLPYSPFEYKRRFSLPVLNIGGSNPPVVIADFSQKYNLNYKDFASIGYQYDKENDKWHIQDRAADLVYLKEHKIPHNLPGNLIPIIDAAIWKNNVKHQALPLYNIKFFLENHHKNARAHVVEIDAYSQNSPEITNLIAQLKEFNNIILLISTQSINKTAFIRKRICDMIELNLHCPIVVNIKKEDASTDQLICGWSAELGSLFIDGLADGLMIYNSAPKIALAKQYDKWLFQNNIAFQILQATRQRISKTEYISCPSCGRTLFDLQETTAKIKEVTSHLKNVKIAIMGCIVNGPGEMADADFGYVGSGVNKITLYKGKDIVKRNVDSKLAVNELINLLKENDVWIEKEQINDNVDMGFKPI